MFIVDGQLRFVKNSLNLVAIIEGSSIDSLFTMIDFGDLLDESAFFNLLNSSRIAKTFETNQNHEKIWLYRTQFAFF